MLTIGIIISCLVLFVGLGILLYCIVRENHLNYPINTKCGLRIQLSPKTTYLTAKEIEQWVDELVQFWSQKKGWTEEAILGSIKDTKVDMYDQKFIRTVIIKDGEHVELTVSAITYPVVKVISIATLPNGNLDTKKRVYLLFKHELSHIIASYLGGYWDQDASHQLFTELGLGA